MDIIAVPLCSDTPCLFSPAICFFVLVVIVIQGFFCTLINGVILN